MSALGRWPFLLVVASCLLFSGCVCGLVGALDGLMLDVQVTGGTLPPGSYSIVARVKTVELRIDETLGEGGEVTPATPNPEAVIDGQHLVLDGAVFSQFGMITVRYNEGGGPAEVTIEVWRAETMLVQHTYRPSYAEYRPNGTFCPPEVEQARDTLVFEAPAT